MSSGVPSAVRITKTIEKGDNFHNSEITSRTSRSSFILNGTWDNIYVNFPFLDCKVTKQVMIGICTWKHRYAHATYWINEKCQFSGYNFWVNTDAVQSNVILIGKLLIQLALSLTHCVPRPNYYHFTLMILTPPETTKRTNCQWLWIGIAELKWYLYHHLALPLLIAILLHLLNTS